MKPVIVTLTRFPDIFARFQESCEKYEPDAIKVVVTSGGAKIDASGWIVREGIEPFVFARNANLGMAGFEAHDVLLVNDDCELTGELTVPLKIATDLCNGGIMAPTIIGGVGNKLQRFRLDRQIGSELSSERLAFVCVWLPASTRALVGPLDERFNGYGGDDVEYCARARKLGLTLWVVRGCLPVKHGYPPHTYSSSFLRLMSHQERNRQMAAMDRLVKPHP